MKPSKNLSTLIEIMAALRDPKTGCPWDLDQDFSSIRHCAIEEAYEVADAIEREDYVDLRDELGDLLLQPVFHAQLAKEQGLFDIEDVILSINEKLIRRHPHVFGDVNAKTTGVSHLRQGYGGQAGKHPKGATATRINDPKGAKASWDKIKEIERAKKLAEKGLQTEEKIFSILDDVPKPLPALSRADKLSRRAAEVGFDWEDWQATFDKCLEELEEVKEAIINAEVGKTAAVSGSGQPARCERIEDRERPTATLEKSSGVSGAAIAEQAKGERTTDAVAANIQEEIGDVLFAVTNLARQLGVDPEAALRDANLKFTRRFAYVEKRCKEDNIKLKKAGLERLDGYWNEIREQDKTS